MSLHSLSISELQSQLRSKALSPVEVMETLERRIAEVDPHVQGYLSRDFDAALELAKHADVSLPLGGVPVAIKDVINVLPR
jgi:aspartyl-tRNA(Asn)/glutamyl-tRNA(Gln) amidotransferase subunit A